MGQALDGAMVPALQAAGPPEARLRAMIEASSAAREAFASAGGSPTLDYNGMDQVVVDLKQAFFLALSQAIAEAQRPASERLAALDALDALVEADWPVGLPADNELARWTIGARLDGHLSVQLAREAVGGS